MTPGTKVIEAATGRTGTIAAWPSAMRRVPDIVRIVWTLADPQGPLSEFRHINDLRIPTATKEPTSS